MVVLQNDPAAMMMVARITARSKRNFDSGRPLQFEIRSIKGLANRTYDFEAFRMLHYDIIVDDTVDKREKAKELNIQGVKLYKEGKLDEAQWCFEKAISIDTDYENAKKNLETLNTKISARNARKNKEAKEGKTFAEVSREISRENAETSTAPTQVEYQEPVAYKGPSITQQGYNQESYQQKGYQQDLQPSSRGQYLQNNYKCPGCGIPVKENWVMCTNCGTDLRQYPPIQ